MELHLSQDPEADALLSQSSFALIVGMVLDQQVPLEWAFASPLELQRRLGEALDPKRIADMDPEALVSAFSSRPALHRYPGSMATRVQEVAQLLVERYGARTEGIWEGVTSGDELLRRVKELPGFGEQKAKIFVALLGKQLGVRPDGWDTVSAPFGERGSFRSVADITDEDTLNKVRAYKQALKAANKAKAAAGGDAKPPAKKAPAKKAAAKEPVTKKAAPKKAATKKTAAERAVAKKALAKGA